MISSTLDQCNKQTEANWPMVAITLIIAIAAIIIFTIYRLTDKERLRIQMSDDVDYFKITN